MNELYRCYYTSSIRGCANDFGFFKIPMMKMHKFIQKSLGYSNIQEKYSEDNMHLRV